MVPHMYILHTSGDRPCACASARGHDSQGHHEYVFWEKVHLILQTQQDIFPLSLSLSLPKELFEFPGGGRHGFPLHENIHGDTIRVFKYFKGCHKAGQEAKGFNLRQSQFQLNLPENHPKRKSSRTMQQDARGHGRVFLLGGLHEEAGETPVKDGLRTASPCAGALR